MSRPLHLGMEARQVLLDGPALRVSTGTPSSTRVPLRLLTRITSRIGTEWSTAALTRCLALGVPVTFMSNDGRPVGFCVPARQRQADLSRLLSGFENDPDSFRAFDDWGSAEERRAILNLIRRNPVIVPSDDLRPNSLRAAFLARTGIERPWAESILERLEAMLAAHMVQLLRNAGLGPRWGAPVSDGRIDLFGACNRSARWLLLPMLCRLLKHRRDHATAWQRPGDWHRRLARAYEAGGPAVAGATSRRLRRLELWLWERRL